MATKSARTRTRNPRTTDRTVKSPASMIVTLMTMDAIIAFARTHVTVDNVASLIGIVRDTFRNAVRGRNIGRTTGWRIMDFQNRILEIHTSEPFTGAQLVFIGACEFPIAVGRIFAPVRPGTDTIDVSGAVSVWSGVIGLYNAGRHANVIPASPAPMIETSRRRSAPAPAPVVTPAPAAPAKPAARLVRKRRAA